MLIMKSRGEVVGVPARLVLFTRGQAVAILSDVSNGDVLLEVFELRASWRLAEKWKMACSILTALGWDLGGECVVKGQEATEKEGKLDA